MEKSVITPNDVTKGSAIQCPYNTMTIKANTPADLTMLDSDEQWQTLSRRRTTVNTVDSHSCRKQRHSAPSSWICRESLIFAEILI